MRVRARSHSRPATRIGFNATPMIDVIFMLTVFFMLVSSFSSAENVPLQLPQPTDSQASTARIPDRVVINALPADPDDPSRGAALYRIGPNPPVSLDVLAAQLATHKQAVPKLKVVLRADRRLPYSAVQAVMRIIARNEIEMIHVGAETGSGAPRP